MTSIDSCLASTVSVCDQISLYLSHSSMKHVWSEESVRSGWLD